HSPILVGDTKVHRFGAGVGMIRSEYLFEYLQGLFPKRNDFVDETEAGIEPRQITVGHARVLRLRPCEGLSNDEGAELVEQALRWIAFGTLHSSKVVQRLRGIERVASCSLVDTSCRLASAQGLDHVSNVEIEPALPIENTRKRRMAGAIGLFG